MLRLLEFRLLSKMDYNIFLTPAIFIILGIFMLYRAIRQGNKKENWNWANTPFKKLVSGLLIILVGVVLLILKMIELFA